MATLLFRGVTASLCVACGLSVAAQSGLAQDTPQVIESIDRALAQAFIHRDVVTLQRTYADTYVFTDPTGRVSTKAQMIESFTKGAINITAQDISDVAVQVYGDVAVETGRLTSSATRDGRDSSGTFRFTRVWVNRDGRWQTVAFQETRTQ